MVIQHNLLAMNSNRMLGMTTTSRSKTTEKLSSGYKINRAADDAAGLAISEKMRRQIRGLTQASTNAQDGISMVQIAEGALNEVHDMLQRMNELAVKAANGTLTSVDRDYIQSEVWHIASEIDRVSSTTTFNEIPLLDGGGNIHSPDAYKEKFADILGISADEVQWHKDTFIYTCTDPDKGKELLQRDKDAVDQGLIESKYTYLGSLLANAMYGVYEDEFGRQPLNVSGHKIYMSDGSRVTFSVTIEDRKLFSLQVGSEAGQHIDVEIATMSAGGLGVYELSVAGNDGQNAENAIDSVKKAIQMVSKQRADLGVVQNRLEHTINNLDNIVENTTSAESLIRDSDIATLMVEYANQNVLAQAGQAMLTQANQNNQLALSLLS